jgi:HSP20 family molecular chaperone IbpA
MDDDKDRKRKSIFDIIDELMKDINKMMKDLMEGNIREGEPPGFKGFSIYMGPDGIDIRDINGNPIGPGREIKELDRFPTREFLRLDYDIMDEDGRKIVYVDLRRIPTSNIKVEKDGYILRVKYKDKVYSVTLPKELSDYSIESHEVKNGVLKIIFKKKKSLFRL